MSVGADAAFDVAGVMLTICCRWHALIFTRVRKPKVVVIPAPKEEGIKKKKKKKKEEEENPRSNLKVCSVSAKQPLTGHRSVSRPLIFLQVPLSQPRHRGEGGHRARCINCPSARNLPGDGSVSFNDPSSSASEVATHFRDRY